MNPWEMLFFSDFDAVLVVAHPDDEALWCGGLLTRSTVKWTVICCSIPRRDPIRAWKFFDACYRLDVSPVLIPFAESPPGEPLRHLDLLDLERFDVVVTHGSAGEYGHVHHQQLHRHVAERWGEKTLGIGFREGGEGKYVVELNDFERGAKIDALKAYDHVLPYRGADITKWEALLAEYGDRRGFNLFRETYDAL